MTDERKQGIEEDLLREYQQTEIKLEAFRLQFKDAADSYTILARLFRKDPESFAPDIKIMSAELQRLADMAKEYKDLLYKNAERKTSLIKMKAI
jgi:ABC-type uncharacterized transport system involved in gliding motility auxiliary subunit